MIEVHKHIRESLLIWQRNDVPGLSNPILTPHGRLTLGQVHNAAAVDAQLAQRVQCAFARGSGHGLLQLGANEIGMALPATLSYWREFAATYVTAVCTQLGPVSERRNLHVPVPANSELEQFVLSAPPMTGAEYLTAAVLSTLWQELDQAFADELSEASCGVEEFLKRRNPAWNLVGRVHFNPADNRKDEAASFAFLATYTTRLSAHAKAQHLPLGHALREYAGAANRSACSLFFYLCSAPLKAAPAKGDGGCGRDFPSLAVDARTSHAAAPR